MKAKSLHEGCIEQMQRLFAEHLYTGSAPTENAFIRIDDWEMREDVQAEVASLWEQITTENVMALSDLAGYRHEFQRLFGFDMEGVDYDKEVEVIENIPSI